MRIVSCLGVSCAGSTAPERGLSFASNLKGMPSVSDFSILQRSTQASSSCEPAEDIHVIFKISDQGGGMPKSLQREANGDRPGWLVMLAAGTEQISS